MDQHIHALPVDHPDYQMVLDTADQIISELNNGVYEIIPDCHQATVLLALATWKQIAEERQEHLDWHNASWIRDGFDDMIRPKTDAERAYKKVQEENP